MATTCKSPITLIAGEVLEPFRRVKLSSTGRTVVYADQADSDGYIGVTNAEGASAIGDPVAVILREGAETIKMVAADSFSANATLYAANDGKVSDSVSGNPIGTALDAATAAGDIVEVLPSRGTGSVPGASSIQNYEAAAGGVPFIVKATCTATEAGDVTVIASMPRKALVTRAWMIARDTNAANVKIKNAGNDMTDAKAKGVTNNGVVNFDQILAAQDEIAAGAAVAANFSAAAAADIFLLCIPIA